MDDETLTFERDRPSVLEAPASDGRPHTTESREGGGMVIRNSVLATAIIFGLQY
jgi:hypothetical protein